MNRLYALLDEATLRANGWSLERFVEAATRHGAELLQYRDKEADDREVATRLKRLVKLFNGRVIVNDRPALARLCGGVHLGQEDLGRFGETKEEAVAAVRRMIGTDRWLGLSTHDEAEVREANGLALDYIGLGAYRATRTKRDARVLGPRRLEEIAALSRHPVAAIGGIGLEDTIANVRWKVVGSALYED